MFQQYNTDQLILPLDVEVFISLHHVCRVVDHAIEQVDMNLFLSQYPGGGRPSFHPKLMLKIIVYAYIKGIYSSRKIAEQVEENIYFMWLARHQKPNFRTINRFRSERMKDKQNTDNGK